MAAGDAGQKPASYLQASKSSKTALSERVCSSSSEALLSLRRLGPNACIASFMPSTRLFSEIPLDVKLLNCYLLRLGFSLQSI